MQKRSTRVRLNEVVEVQNSEYIKTAWNSSESKPKLLPIEINEMVNYAAQQAAYWETKFKFSHIKNPDLDAEKEWKAWEITWNSFVETLDKEAPELVKLSRKMKFTLAVSYFLDWNIDYYQTKPLEGKIRGYLGSLAQILYNIHMKWIAGKIYSHSIFPRFTVGRRA